MKAGAAASAHERFADLVHFGPVAYARLGPKGIIDEINQAGRRLFARTSSELLGTPMVTLMTRDCQADFVEHLRRTRQNDGVVTTRLSIDCGGRRSTPVAAYSKRFFADGRMVCWMMLLDLAERVRLEDERRHADEQRVKAEQDQQQHRSRSADKDRFLAMLSHELRTPLTPALLAADHLLRGSTDASISQMAGVIKRNIEIEAQLINDLLDVTRIGRGRLDLSLSPIDLHAVILEAMDVCGGQAVARQMRIVTDFRATASVVSGDRLRLRQVLWNLIINAIKFGEAGAVHIRTVNDECGSIRASITDEGPGVDPDLLSRLFRPFERSETSVGGLGLGLSISRGIIDAHGGRIWASSPGQGAGATFVIELPTLTTGTVVFPDAPRSQPANAAMPRRILVVENDPDTAEMLALLLRDDGHTVKVAKTLVEALEAVTDSWDVVLSDLGLPDGSGLDIGRAVKANVRRPRLIAVSGYGTPQDLANSKEAGFDIHLVKPMDFDELRRLLQ